MNEVDLVAALSRDGAATVLTAARALATSAERTALLRLAVRKIAFGTWTETQRAPLLDAMLELGDAAIAEALRAGATDEANVICYNMAANLCDCWGDGFPRTTRHFERGLQYAERALAFRRELGKAPDKLAMAHWARGKHLLSLRRYTDAVNALQENVACLEAAGSVVDAEGMLSARAYLALARRAAGDADAMPAYDAALAEMRALATNDPAKAADVKVYIDQLALTAAALSAG